MRHVQVQALDPQRLEALIGPERSRRFEEVAAATRGDLQGRRILNVNSTAAGGGVAELLQTLLAYARGVGIDARWSVIDADAPFFMVTKRLHNRIYGAPGDGGRLGPEEHRVYEEALRSNADELRSAVQPGDVVVLHDPQTAGLAKAAHEAGGIVVWRCHIGRDTPNGHTEEGWAFVHPYLEDADAVVFSHQGFVPEWCAADRTAVIPPSIDPFSAKNQPIDPATARAILQYAGLLAGAADPPTVPFTRRDGSPGRLDRRADILQTGPPPPPDAPLVVQISRWDRMKDMRGVLQGFVERLDGHRGVHLVLVGPVAHGVEDDPEGGQVLDECIEAWRELPVASRARVHLACLPMHDPDEQSMMVNALQRHSTVVCQKSLAEGFGLTVTEALWKARPVVASRVGGIGDQIVDGESGILLDDPTDLEAFGHAVAHILDDPSFAERLGAAGQRRAHEDFLGDRHLERWGDLIRRIDRI